MEVGGGDGAGIEGEEMDVILTSVGVILTCVGVILTRVGVILTCVWM